MKMAVFLGVAFGLFFAKPTRAADIQPVTVRVLIPEDVLSDQFTIVNARLGCAKQDGDLSTAVFLPEDFASGTREKIIFLDWKNVKSCTYAVGLMPAHFPPTVSDFPLWLPIGLNEIRESVSIEPRNVIEIGLGSWKISNLNITVNPSAFENRDAQALILNIGSKGYNLAWPKEIQMISHEKAPLSFKSRILYQEMPTLTVKSIWKSSSSFKKESYETQNFDLRFE